MKLLILLLSICFIGCEAVPAKKHKKRKSSIKSVQVVNPKEITSDQYSIIVPDSWMRDYERLSKKHGKTVPGDQIIWQEGTRYHIPVDVAQSYIDLKKKEGANEHGRH